MLFIHTSWPSWSRTSQYLPFTHTHYTSWMRARARARVFVCVLRGNFCLNATAACQPSLGCASLPHTRFVCRHNPPSLCDYRARSEGGFPQPTPLPRAHHPLGTWRSTAARRTCRQVCCQWRSGVTRVGFHFTLPRARTWKVACCFLCDASTVGLR